MRELFAFFGAVLRDPRGTGAVAPSSLLLARAITAPLRRDIRPLRVLEVGGGTGAITRTLLRRLKRGDELVVYEPNPALRRVLERRLSRVPRHAPGAAVRIVGAPIETIDPEERFDYVFSGLPLNNFPPERVERILELLTRLARGGTLTWFEYAGLRSLRRRLVRPRERSRVRSLDRILDRYLESPGAERRLVLWNVPPAWIRRLPSPPPYEPSPPPQPHDRPWFSARRNSTKGWK